MTNPRQSYLTAEARKTQRENLIFKNFKASSSFVFFRDLRDSAVKFREVFI